MEKRLQRWNRYSRLRDNYVETADWRESTPPQLRKKVKNRPKLTNAEILAVAYKVIVLGERQVVIAKEYRVTRARISQIVRKVQADNDVLEEMRAADVAKSDRRATIRQVIERMVQQSDHVGAAIDVCWVLQHELGLDVKRWEVYRVLKQDLGMSYRRIVQNAAMGNSVRNLVLRQQWALQYFRLAAEGKQFMNIDET